MRLYFCFLELAHSGVDSLAAEKLTSKITVHPASYKLSH